MKPVSVLTPVVARRLGRVALVSLLVSVGGWSAHAAAVVEVSRRLMTIVDLMDYSPMVGDETFDITGDGTGLPAYARTAITTNVANDNSGTGTAQIDSAFDAAALMLSGSGGSSLNVSTRFDAADIAAGAVLDGYAGSSAAFAFRLDRAGKVVLSGALAAGGVGQRAWVRVERRDGSGVALWSRLVTTGSLSYSAEVALDAGTYQVLVNAVSDIDVNTAGAIDQAGAASWSVTAQVVEPPPAGGGKPGKPRK